MSIRYYVETVYEKKGQFVQKATQNERNHV
jgi:hypothetical protein